MGKGIPFQFELKGVDLNNYWGAGTPEDCPQIHNARLFISGEEIYVDVYYRLATRLGDKFASWYQKDCKLGVAHYLLAHIPEDSRLTRSIDFSNSKCISFNTGGKKDENGLNSIRIRLDQIDIRRGIISENRTYGEFYLNEVGMLLASKFFGPFMNFEETRYEFGCDARINRFEFKGIRYSFQLDTYTGQNDRKDKSVTIYKEPYILLETDNLAVTQDKIFEAASAICSACSFYLLSEVDYTVGRMYNSEGSYEKYKVVKPSILGKGIGLWVLGYQHPIETFLATKWHESIGGEVPKFQRVINKYLLASQTAGSTKFLLLFTILEILKGGEEKTETEFKRVVKNQQEKKNRKDALKLILQNYAEVEHKEFKDKWNSTIIPMMRTKVMKSQFHALFAKHGVSESDFRFDWKSIVSLRTRVIHGSLTGADVDEIESYNDFLFRLAGVLLLGTMGVKEWKLK